MSETVPLVLAAGVAIAVIVGLIVWLKVHPFRSLTIGAFVVGLVAEEDLLLVVMIASTVGGLLLLLAPGGRGPAGVRRAGPADASTE